MRFSRGEKQTALLTVFVYSREIWNLKLGGGEKREKIAGILLYFFKRATKNTDGGEINKGKGKQKKKKRKEIFTFFDNTPHF